MKRRHLPFAALAGAAATYLYACYANHGHVCARCRRTTGHIMLSCQLDDEILCPDCEEGGGGDEPPAGPPDDPGGASLDLRDDLGVPVLTTVGLSLPSRGTRSWPAPRRCSPAWNGPPRNGRQPAATRSRPTCGTPTATGRR